MSRAAGTADVRCVRADNPGPMTLEGTNSWVIGEPDTGAAIVVDPGPPIPAHLAQLRALSGGGVAVVLLTHRHLDHAASAATVAAQAGCGVRAVDPAWRVGPDGLDDGDVLELGDIRLEVVLTPGHTSDSCCFLVTGVDGVPRLLTGDTVLGRGTSVITHPDGNVGDYLASLVLLERLAAERGVRELLPGHGPVVTDPLGWLAFYRRHREERLLQVRDALAAGDRTPAQVVARVYAGVADQVRPAAEQSVRAQLEYLLGPAEEAGRNSANSGPTHSEVTESRGTVEA